MPEQRMKSLVFVQNCISPHQMPYIEALSRRSDVEHVWVVAPRVTYSDRAAMGWPATWTTSSERLTIVIAPDDKQMAELYAMPECVCLFSGISAFPEILHWFRLSIPYRLKRGIITEAPYTYDKPLWMHRLRFAIMDWRYVKYFDYVFAIGEDCVKYYRLWSKRWNVIPFMYCTSPSSLLEASASSRPHALAVCFVGSLDRRKNVGELLSAVEILRKRKVEVAVSIVGDGPLRDALEQQASTIVSDSVSIDFLGALPMPETQRVMVANDVLVLPSLHDGWGAVINEAMSMGTLPVCSNKCGAKDIVKLSGFGGVYDVGNPDMLAYVLQAVATNINNVRDKRAERVKWAIDNISPDAVGELMMTTINR